MSVDLPADAKARLDAHLDAVEAALTAGGNSRDHRRGVVDDLEAQIREMLQARSATPELADVEAVLAKLDRAEAYAAVGGSNSVEKEINSATPALASRGSGEATPAGERANVKRRRFMKPLVLVALIICGTILVMTPAAFDYLHERNLTEVAMRTTPVPNGVNIRIDSPMQEPIMRFGFWLTGSLAIGFAIIGGFVAFVRDSRRGSE